MSGPLTLSEAGWRPPDVLPANWSIARDSEDGRAWVTLDGMSVIVSVARELDARRWVHLSCARAGRLPTWYDLKTAKETILGNVTAYQVLPTATAYVNIHPNCLHLFYCLDGDPLPDFTRGGTSL